MDTRFSSKQALWFTLINYIGVLIGTVSTLFIYPQDTELLGVFRFVDGFAQVLYPVLVLGASTALLNFQPKLNTYLQRKLFTYSLFSVFAMILFCCVGIYAIYQIDVLKNKEYFSYGFVIAVCLAYVDVFKRQATNLQKLAVPTFYEKVMPKLALPFVFLLILKTGLDTKQGLTLYTVAFVLVLLGIVMYLFRYFKPVLSTNFTDLFQEIPRKAYYQYSLYAFCASLGSFFAFRIDSLMIPQFISNQANGDFSIGVNLANALMIPATGVFALYSPLISKSLKNDDLSLLQIKYIEVAKNLFFIGIILYGCVLLGMHDLFELLPTADKLLPILPILYILGGNVVLNMATGFNTEIIAYSQHYRFNLTAILLLAVLNIGLNYYILTQTNYGIIGVAWASLFAMSLFNIVKLWFIYKQFNIIPFNRSYLKTVVLSLALLLFFYWLPVRMVEGFDFVIRCGLYVLVLSSLLYRLGWVPEWNKSVNKFKNRFIG